MTRTWETKNPGTNEDRTTEIEGTRFKIHSGHGFRADGPTGHAMGGFENTNLTRDQVENGIVDDIMTNVPMESIPSSSGGATRPYVGNVNVDGVNVEYKAVNVNGQVNIGTYYPAPEVKE